LFCRLFNRQFARKKTDKLSQNIERNSEKISIFNSLIVLPLQMATKYIKS